MIPRSARRRDRPGDDQRTPILRLWVATRTAPVLPLLAADRPWVAGVTYSTAP